MYCVLLASYAVNAADRQLFPLLAHDVRAQYGFSLSDTGLLTTIFTLGLAVAGLPTGFLLARFSRKTVLLLLGLESFPRERRSRFWRRGFPDMLVYLAATGIGEAMQLTVMIAIAANYFVGYRAAAIGSMNVFFGLGAFSGPILGGILLTRYRTWHVPMIAFGILGYMMIALIAFDGAALVQRDPPRRRCAHGSSRGADALELEYDYLDDPERDRRPRAVWLHGHVPDLFAGGAALHAEGGGVRHQLLRGGSADFHRRRVAGRPFFAAGRGELRVFSASLASDTCAFTDRRRYFARAILAFAYGAIGSGTIYVNLAAYHVKAVRSSLSSRASGMFVTSLYAAAAAAGY